MIKERQSNPNKALNTKNPINLIKNQSTLLENELLKYLKEKDNRLEALIYENATLKIKIEQLRNQT
ncbi:hypothetical protein DDZ16_13120 [Marinilabilia rubra]|uniref:Uncharacterized protein n=1 Tax=Marinilabilia rubra TaxID=2162893 RepID=A0A2U2B775_9BACT|nr:hypothetical protein DDZ16_13120 [Marinilabilia rubra]